MMFKCVVSVMFIYVYVRGQATSEDPLPESTQLTTPQPKFSANCSMAGTINIVNGSSQCVCKSGFTGQTCEECHTCHNAGACRTRPTYGTAMCECVAGTTGLMCETYLNTATSQKNIALNKTVLHCKSGAMSTYLANSSLWNNYVDVCYNLTIDNVIIVDLGADYDVYNVTIVGYNMTSVNTSVSVGRHLSEGCGVMHEVHCAVVRFNMSSYPMTWSCTYSTTGRYIRVKNTGTRKVVVCIHQASGTPHYQTQRQAKFSNVNAKIGPGVSAFKELPSDSRLSCARICLQEQKCLNFRWTDGKCSLYGGPLGDTDTDWVFHLSEFNGGCT